MIRVKNNLNKNTYLLGMNRNGYKKLGIALIAASLMSSVSTSAFADISNTATAKGTYGTTDVDSNTSTVNVPVTTDRGLSTTLALAEAPSVDDASGGHLSYTDGGDTIKYTFTVTNTGNLTETSITNAALPKFNNVTGTGTWSFQETSTPGTGVGSLASLAPNESVTFVGTYTMSDADAFNAAGVSSGVKLTANASSTGVASTSADSADSSEITTTVAAGSALELAKTYVLEDTTGATATNAELGYKVTYTYTVTNIGNVPIADVSIEDSHEDLNLDFNDIQGATIASADDGPLGSTLGSTAGKISSLAAGAKATFTYVHTVTQSEIDG